MFTTPCGTKGGYTDVARETQEDARRIEKEKNNGGRATLDTGFDGSEKRKKNGGVRKKGKHGRAPVA